MVKKDIKVIDLQYQNTVARNKTGTQIKGGIPMTDTDPIKRAQTLITDLNKPTKHANKQQLTTSAFRNN